MSTFFSSISILVFAAVFITRIRNDYWLFRVFEYPRLQKLFLAIALIAGWLIAAPFHHLAHYISFALLLVAAGYLLYKVYPYTVVCKKEMKDAAPGERGKRLKLFTANVYQENTRYADMLEQIRAEDPDVVFLLETNRAWCEAMSVLKKDYPYFAEQPQENTYGLLFYSRIPAEDTRVRFLVKDDIPSLEATLVLEENQIVRLLGLHPEPPVPGENLYATAKDKELMKAALEVKDCPHPCIVFGDLNDVAWSHTTELFRKTSRLLDPRIGRGFYATFSAHSWLIRFPLDYIFCSDRFRLAGMKRMPKNGSDHFATVISLVLCPVPVEGQEAPQSNSEELREAKEKAAQPLPASDS